MTHSHVLVLASSLLLAAVPPSLPWPVNEYDQEFTFICSDRQALSHVASTHSNPHEDRKFDLSCRELAVSGQPTCHWTQYVNEFDEAVAFQCPHEGYIAGMSSVHHNGFEDRRYKFYCCFVPDKIRHNCLNTEWLNNWDDPFAYQVPVGQIISGMFSYHHNDYEDRRFKLNICTLSNSTNK